MAKIEDDIYGVLTGTPGLSQIETDVDNIDNINIAEYIDVAFRESGGPGYSTALVNMLKGIRVLGPGNQLAPLADDTIGLAFVSRPLLNLSDENCKKHSQLLPLYKPNSNSIMAYVKGMLDRRWASSNNPELLDNNSAWIVPITNLLKVSSGFPDISLNISKSKPGFRKEVYQYVDGILKHNSDYDIRQSYHNPKPNFLPYMFEAWLHYIEGVTIGDEGLEPYPEALDSNYIDYDTRIYHMILNKNMKNIEWLFCTAQSIPSTFPSGAFSTIDRTGDSLRGQGQDEFDINFSSTGFRFGNIKIADMFNRTTLFFNKDLTPDIRSKKYKKLATNEYFSYAYSSYPWINLKTMELEYWGLK